MAQQILDGGLFVGRHQFEAHAVVQRVMRSNAHHGAFERGQVLGHRVGELHLAVFHQHHQSGRDQRLGHGVNAKHRIELHGCIAAVVELAKRLGIDQLAFTRHHRHRTGQALLLNLGLQGLGEFLQALGRHAYRFRVYLGQSLRPSPARL